MLMYDEHKFRLYLRTILHNVFRNEHSEFIKSTMGSWYDNGSTGYIANAVMSVVESPQQENYNWKKYL